MKSHWNEEWKCPLATHRAIDMGGHICYFKGKPQVHVAMRDWWGVSRSLTDYEPGYDATDWQNTLQSKAEYEALISQSEIEMKHDVSVESGPRPDIYDPYSPESIRALVSGMNETLDKPSSTIEGSSKVRPLQGIYEKDGIRLPAWVEVRDNPRLGWQEREAVCFLDGNILAWNIAMSRIEAWNYWRPLESKPQPINHMETATRFKEGKFCG